MAGYTEEQFAAAKAAGSKEELIEMASGAGFELTDEEAEHFMAQIAQREADSQSNEAPGEISVDELENVAGGYCKDKRGREIVTPVTWCFHGERTDCVDCSYLSYEKGIMYCNWNVRSHEVIP